MLNWAEHIQMLHRLSGRSHFLFTSPGGPAIRVLYRTAFGSRCILTDDRQRVSNTVLSFDALNLHLSLYEDLMLVESRLA